MENSRDCTTEIGALSASEPEACKQRIFDALFRTGGGVTEAARELHISRPFLWHLLRKYGLEDVPATLRREFQARYRVESEKDDDPLPKS